MTASSTRSPVPLLVALVVAVVMLGAGLGRFGIWQPSELRIADAAREEAGAQPQPQTRPALQVALVRMGFRGVGPTEQGGRLPTAVFAILATLALGLAVASASDRRAGALVAIAYATTPLVFMNARQMFGGGAAQSAVTLFLASGIYVFWGRPPPADSGARYSAWRLGRWALLATFLLGVYAAGWMLGVAPVLVGVGAAAVLRWRDEPRSNRVAGALMLAAGLVLAAVSVRAAMAPHEAYNALTGVGPDARPPAALPTHEALIEHIGHGLFPWTGIVAFGIVRLLVPPPTAGVKVGPGGAVASDDDAWRESGARLAAFCAATVAFGLQSVHLQQFGPSPYVAVASLAIAAGLVLRDAEREAQAWRLVVAGATFVTLIMMRDYLQFPKTSYAALALPDGGPAFPSGFTGTLRDWFRAQGAHAPVAMLKSNAPGEVYFLVEALLFILVALSALFQGAGPVRAFPLARPYTWLIDVERLAQAQYAAEYADRPAGRFAWARSLTGLGILAHLRVWLASIALVLMVAFGLGSTNRGFTTPVKSAFVAVASLPVTIVVCTYFVLLLWNLFAWLGSPGRLGERALGSRVGFVPLAAVLVGLMSTQLFVPALSEHLSPRGVWAVIRQVRREGEPVARFGGFQSDRATRYYANFDVRDLYGESEAVEWLRQRTPRHYLVVSADVFPSLNRAYRQAYPQGERQNIPVIDATNSNLYVAASDAGDRGSRNPLDAVVMSRDTLTRRGTDHWHPHGRWEGGRFIEEPARFDEAIEYLGYNLDSNGMSYVPVGGSFKIKYHFRVTREVSGNHQIFVHVDGQCPRINGDHEPAGGRYPVRYWLPGDFIHDEHRITIPGYCRAGRYYVYMGFFQGDDRMRVQGGDHDRENRVVAAIINVR